MTEEYRRYLASPRWQQTRQKALAYHGRYCAVCGGTRRLQAHHLRYWKDGQSILGRESMSDFRILCKKHHPKGSYSASQIERDRHSIAFARVFEWLVFLPFRLAWRLVRFAWKAVRS